MNPTGAPPAFSPHEWMALYLRGRHGELTAAFLGVLRHFRDHSYQALDPQGQRFVDEFTKQFLHLFTQADYAPDAPSAAEFVRLGPILSNVVALSCFATTDAHLPLAALGPSGTAKTLALLSARNSARFDRRSFFDADPTLASLWYGAYGDLYRTGLLNPRVVANLRDHFRDQDDRLDAHYAGLDAFFASTYVGGDVDRVCKPALNRAVRRRNSAEGLTVRPGPRIDPGSVAVVSGHWRPEHSSYRINAGFQRALRGRYHLTLVRLGTRDADLSGFDEVIPIVADPSGRPDLGPLQQRGFAAAWFPDVGLNPLSVVLANLRIAPVQVATLGHSVSTWGSEVDYFVSGVAVETPDRPERHYSERLVLLPGTGAVHERPAYRPRGNIPPAGGELILNCPWAAQKLNHEFGLTLRSVLSRATWPVRLRLFVSASLNRRNDHLPFVRDLSALLEGTSATIDVRQGLPYPDYMAMMEEGAFTLDSHPFGGCNTVADSLHLRRPVVTMEGDHWYGRVGSQMVRAAGLPELAATDPAGYASAVLSLIDDAPRLAALQSRLACADLDATLFDQADAPHFAAALGHLIAHHHRLSQDPDRTPLRFG